ncbi:helix-turn-helix transcriptional regulator [bacterium]|nr:helix-turn-helix transcriptional regulator [bacterium]
MAEDDILKTFGLNVKIARLKKNLTQAQLAEILNIHEKHVCKIETGHQNVTLKTLSKIAYSLDIEENALLLPLH